MPQKSGHSRKLGVNHCLPSGCWQHPRSLSLESRHIRASPPTRREQTNISAPEELSQNRWRVHSSAATQTWKAPCLPRETESRRAERKSLKKRVSYPLCPQQELPERRLGRFSWRLMHIFYWLVLSASDQSGPEGDDVLMCKRVFALFLERTSQGALDSHRLQNPSRLRSAARGEGRGPQDALFTFRS